MEQERRKKSDKAKEKRDRNPYSKKHVRIMEALVEKKAKTGKN
jgi:hypothetical protein